MRNVENHSSIVAIKNNRNPNDQFRKQSQEVFYNKGVLKKKILAQVFSCEFYEIFKNTFFYRITPDDCHKGNDSKRNQQVKAWKSSP